MRLLHTAAACALAVSLFAGLSAARAQDNSPATISTVGCLDGEPDSLRFEDESGVYRLTGNTRALEAHLGEAVAIRAVPHSFWLATPGRVLEVISGNALAAPAAAALDRDAADPARWRDEVSPRWGISIAFPGERMADAGAGPRPRLPFRDNVAAIHRSAIPAKMFPRSDFDGGYFAVFADRNIRGAGRCASASPRSRGKSAPPNTLSLAGIDYAAADEAGAGPLERTQYLRTFHNGICYEFAFQFTMADRGEIPEMGCMVRSADPAVLARLIVSELSFFPPERHRRASR